MKMILNRLNNLEEKLIQSINQQQRNLVSMIKIKIQIAIKINNRAMSRHNIMKFIKATIYDKILRNIVNDEILIINKK